ncbi:hypothetical protein ABFX02_14G203300 [Erythranthe guttata]
MMMIGLLHCHSHFPIQLNLYSSPQIKPKIRPILCSISKPRNQTILGRVNSSNNGRDPVKDPSFFDENGAVEDMDGYLNYLSLEYDSVWDTKPSWCQPWTIALTGVGITGGSWLVLNSVVVTSIVATLISLWWYIFLYSYPKAYSDMIAERRKKVKGGTEDTYGKQTWQ